MSMNRNISSALQNDLFQALVDSRPGKQAIVAIDAPKQSVQWIGAAGVNAAGEAVTKKTPYFIASIDKLYNATIAMKLMEADQLDLDKSICDYLPDAITQGLHLLEGKDRTAAITIRHLLTHASGLPDWFEDYPKRSPSLADIVFEEGDRELTRDELFGHVRDRLKPHFPPQDLTKTRQKIRYSDTNFILLAEIIEAVTGQPLHEVHQQLLYEPLGLSHTYFLNHSSPLSPTPPPMVLRVKGEPLHIPLLVQSIKGIYSTAADMMRFIRLLMKGDVFEKPETLATMMNGWRRFGLPLDKAALRSPNWPIEYAMGMMRFRVPRLFTPFAPIPAAFGHTGSTGCWLFYCPELDAALSGSVEDATAGPVPFQTAPKMLRLLSQLG